MCQLVVFSIFTRSYSHHYHPVPGRFYCPSKTPLFPLAVACHCPAASPWQPLTLCLGGLTCSGCFIEMKSCKMWPSVSDFFFFSPSIMFSGFTYIVVGTSTSFLFVPE